MQLRSPMNTDLKECLTVSSTLKCNLLSQKHCRAMNCLVSTLGGCGAQTKAELKKIGFDVDHARQLKKTMGCG